MFIVPFLFGLTSSESTWHLHPHVVFTEIPICKPMSVINILFTCYNTEKRCLLGHWDFVILFLEICKHKLDCCQNWMEKDRGQLRLWIPVVVSNALTVRCIVNCYTSYPALFSVTPLCFHAEKKSATSRECNEYYHQPIVISTHSNWNGA